MWIKKKCWIKTKHEIPSQIMSVESAMNFLLIKRKWYDLQLPKIHIFCVTPLGFHWFLGVLFFYQSFTALRFSFICKLAFWVIILHLTLIQKLKKMKPLRGFCLFVKWHDVLLICILVYMTFFVAPPPRPAGKPTRLIWFLEGGSVTILSPLRGLIVCKK